MWYNTYCIFIVLKKQDTKTMSRHTIKPHFNIRNVKVWQAGDPDEPHFDENFEIAKYAVFQVGPSI